MEEELDIRGWVACAVIAPLTVMFGHGCKLLRYRVGGWRLTRFLRTGLAHYLGGGLKRIILDIIE